MNLEEIVNQIPEDDSLREAVMRIKLLTGIRNNHELYKLLGSIIGVNPITMYRWLNGTRGQLRNTQQPLRCLQMVELLLRRTLDEKTKIDFPRLQNRLEQP